MTLLEAARYFRKLANVPLLYRFSTGKWVCNQCDAKGYSKSGLKHTDFCLFAQAEKVLKEASNDNPRGL